MSRVSMIVAANAPQLERIARELAAYPKAQAVIVSRAINKVATAARTQINREVRKNLNIKARDLNKSIAIVKANTARPIAQIKIRGRRVPLVQFSASQTRRGVSYRISPTAGRKSIRSAFIATMPSGHEGVWTRLQEKRTMKRGRYAGKMKQPIVEKFGPSVPAVVGNISTLAAATLDARIAEQLEREIDTQISVFLAQQGGK